MECSVPPPLTDEALSLALDGLADAATLKHLAQCSACMARFANAKRLDTFLTKHLGRIDCPSPQQLGDYHFGILEPADADIISQHLATCPRCREEFEMLVQFVDLSPAADEATNIIPFPSEMAMMRANRIQTMGNVAVGLKGTEDESAHDAKAGSANIFLETKITPEGFLLTGQVLDNEVNWVGAVASIHQVGSPEQVCILDEMCEFSFKLSNDAPLNLYITANTGLKLFVENITLKT